ncbi:MAG: hypothetical protein IPG50_02955 [Myxococcales bacterium]|nr:hypothetical protein [Myxococcales bacterium]
MSAEKENKAESEASEPKEPTEPSTEAQASEDAPQGDAPEADLASPDAIAKRVAALGDEDELERLARLEEEKLAERRAKLDKGKKGGKKGLEAAASKRLAEIGSKPRPVQARSPQNDPVLQKTQEFSKWARQNQKVVAGVIAAVLLVFGGFALKESMAQRTENRASELLAAAVADQRGRVGSEPAEEPEGFQDPSPLFKTAAERRDAALAKYRDVQAKFPGTGAAYLAKLAEGSLLLDRREPDAAIAAFQSVRASVLATADAEVRGRALEGLGFALELKAQGGDAAKLDEAAKIFRELENTDVKGFKELGMYHQARVLEAKGDKDKAKELLKSIRERVNKPGEGHPFPYLESVAEDRLRALDPSALPPKPQMSAGGGPGNKMSDAQMRRMIEQMQKQMKEQADKKGHGGH